MATVICVDGLGGHPETAFRGLKVVLENAGNQVIILDTTSVVTHEDRVRMVLDTFYRCSKTESVFLLGQSAGGSAVRIAAERLNMMNGAVAGVIHLSPAMPFGIFFMTTKLFWVMVKRLIPLLFRRVISTTKSDFELLTAPIAEEMREVVSKRQTVSSVEGRELAFFPPKFVGYSFPTLHIFGSEDVWIAPRAQRILKKWLRKKSHVTTCEIGGAGHLTLASSERELVQKLIQRWIGHMSS